MLRLASRGTGGVEGAREALEKCKRCKGCKSIFHFPGPGFRGTSGFPLGTAEAPESRWLLGSGACPKLGCVLGGERMAGRRRVERSLAGRCAAATADASSAEAL